MGNIAILCGGGEPYWSSTQGLVRAFRNLGHGVWTAGRAYYGRSLADHALPPRDHIEWYSYEEILKDCPFQPDIFVCIDPGSYPNGTRPQNIPSVFFGTDAHRCGVMYRKVLEAGNFDYFFNAQPNYLQFFHEFNVVDTLPAFDAARFKQDQDAEPICDIAFVGQTGLRDLETHLKYAPDGHDEVGKYISNLGRIYQDDVEKFEFRDLPSKDYAERAQLLYRLSQDFDVRIYEPLWDERLQKALQKGRIGFNHSLLRDVGIRIFEYAASGRACVTDDVMEYAMGRTPTEATRSLSQLTVTYDSWLFKPHYENFNLVYEEVKKAVKFALAYWKANGEWARKKVFAHHTWEHRAQEILGKVRL